MDLELKNRTFLISGASQGIGLAIAKSFLAEGANVVITSRTADKLNLVRDELSAQFSPDKIAFVLADITQEDDIKDALLTAVDIFSVIDGVIANLGSGQATQGWEVDRAEWQAMMEINFLSAMALVTQSIPYLKNSDQASITFISSIAGCEAIPAPIPYSAAKAALRHSAKNLSRQLAFDNIRVNTVAPGNILATGGTWERKITENPIDVENYISAEVPMSRIGKAQEVADIVVFLSSNRASFVTGALLVVDGGQSRV